MTLRFEWLAPEVYNEALTYLRREGYRIYAVLDNPERDVFRAAIWVGRRSVVAGYRSR